MLTELDAVNIMLSAIGESPVSFLDSMHPDVLSSVLLLKHARLSVLSPGLSFNTECGVTLVPTVDGTILLPSTCITVDPVEASADYVKRGGLLYDNIRHSFVFTSPVCADVVSDTAFEDIPFHAQDFIVISAALVLQSNFIGDDRKLQVLTARFKNAQEAFNKEELRAGDYNARNTRTARRLLSRAGTYYRGVI